MFQQGSTCASHSVTRKSNKRIGKAGEEKVRTKIVLIHAYLTEQSSLFNLGRGLLIVHDFRFLRLAPGDCCLRLIWPLET